MNRTEAREKATALVAQMTIEEAASQMLHSSPAIPVWAFPPMTGGMKPFMVLPEPVLPPVIRRRLAWVQLLTVNYYRKSPVPSLWKPGQNITLIPASETAPGTKV